MSSEVCVCVCLLSLNDRVAACDCLRVGFFAQLCTCLHLCVCICACLFLCWFSSFSRTRPTPACFCSSEKQGNIVPLKLQRWATADREWYEGWRARVPAFFVFLQTLMIKYIHLENSRINQKTKTAGNYIENRNKKTPSSFINQNMWSLVDGCLSNTSVNHFYCTTQVLQIEKLWTGPRLRSGQTFPIGTFVSLSTCDPLVKRFGPQCGHEFFFSDCCIWRFWTAWRGKSIQYLTEQNMKKSLSYPFIIPVEKSPSDRVVSVYN